MNKRSYGIYMALGIVSDNEFEEALKDSRGVDRSKHVENPLARVEDYAGVGKRNEMPDSMRKVIIDDSLDGVSRKELATLYNTSEQTISNLRTGNNGFDHNKNPEIAKHIKTRKERMIGVAGNKLFAALKELNEGKLVDVTAREAAAIAKDMSSIIKNLEPPPEKSSGAPVAQFVFFAPERMKQVNEYEIVDVKE